MIYRSVGNNLTVNLHNLRLPIKHEQVRLMLWQLGFAENKFDLTFLARGLVGKSQYQRGAKSDQAPSIVDCSSMTKWLYGQIGIWLPRHSIDQRSMGRIINRPQEGDLIFTAGFRNYYWDNPADGVGHVGIVTRDITIIHAANTQRGIVEDPWEEFCKKQENFRGLRRYLPPSRDSLFIQMPNKQVETDRELRWLILQHL